ncbi:MAG: extracellular solute-binding protein [Ruminococcaceae bacterium]|nr:extracellular solute-binding protein [Oscillospiraceae bacterium]
MKRILSLVLVLVMAFSLFSCGKKENNAPEKVALEHVYLSKKIPLPEDVSLYSLFVSGENVYLRGTKDVVYTDEYGVEHYDNYDVIYLSDLAFSEYKEIYTFKGEYSYDGTTFASKSSYLNTVSSDSHGGLWLGIAEYHNYLDETTSQWINKNNVTFYHMDSDGVVTEGFNVPEILKTIDDVEQHEIDNAYVQSIMENGDGKIYIAMENRIIAIDENYKVVNSNSFDNFAYEFSMADNGNIRFPVWDWSGEQGKVEVMEYDTKSYTVNTLTTLATTDNVFFSADGELYTDDWYKVSKVDLKTGEMKPIFDYLNSDVNVDRFQRCAIINDEFYAFEYDKNYENRSLLHLTPAGEGEVIEKYVITLATTEISSNLRDMIIDYNRSSTDYRITVKAYGWEESSIEAFDLDLVSGKIPDIVCLDSLDASKYASKGIFADLGKMMDEDDKFSRDVFLDNIIEATKIKGVIYSMPVSFNIRSVAGKESIFTKPSWTWQDAMNLMRQYSGSKLVDEVDRETFMTSYFPLFLEDFIDYEKGKSSFSSPEFKAFLEFVKTLPAEINWEEFYEGIDWEEYDARFKNNQTLLQQVYFSSVNAPIYLRETFGEDVNFIGYPSADGNGHAIVFDTEFAIANKSVYKQQAWDFLKMVFEEDYQMNYVWSFPVTKSAFEKSKQEEIGYVKGENVDYGIADDDIFIEKELSMIKPVLPEWTNEDQTEYALECIERVANIATTATKVARFNDPVIDIIKGEVSAFFDSKKSIDETCKIIESRVNLYLAENM